MAGCLLLPVEFLAHGDLHERIDALSRSITAQPTNAELFLLRGELHRIHEAPALAIADFERALALDPALDLARLGTGRTFLDAGRPAQACAALSVFLAKHPHHAAAALARARSLSVLGEWRAAAADYSNALSAVHAPLPEIYLERAGVLAKAGALDEAIAGLDEGMARLGHVVPLDERIVDLEVGRKHFAAALARVDGQLARTPRKEFLLCRRGLILEQAGRSDDARAAFRAALGEIATLPPERQSTRALRELSANLQAGLARLGNAAPTHLLSGETGRAQARVP